MIDEIINQPWVERLQSQRLCLHAHNKSGYGETRLRQEEVFTNAVLATHAKACKHLSVCGTCKFVSKHS